MPGHEDHHSPDNSQSSEPLQSDGSLSASSLSANVTSLAFTLTSTAAAQNQNTGNTPPNASVNRTPNEASVPNASTVGPNTSHAVSSEPSTGQDEPDCLLEAIAHAINIHSEPAEDFYQRSNPSTATVSPDHPPAYNDVAASDENHFAATVATYGQTDPPHYKSLQHQATGAASDVPYVNPEERATKGEILRINTNLVRASKRLLDFLACVDAHPELYSGQAVVNAIHRYEYLWLPLLSDYLKKGKVPEIAPPLDVHWIWVVHMLAPQHYKVECEAITGTMLPHRLQSQNSLAIARARGKTLWEAMYPHDPWEVDYQNLKKIIPRTPSKIRYDLIKAVGRQCAFYYQVSLAHYRVSSFLNPAVQRYRKFVKLKKLEPKTFLVPCYDMDLVWHAHQLHPVSYYNDTMSFLGCLLPHDDSVNNREAGSKLVVSDGITRQLWKDTWREDFSRNGGMYRGDPPDMYIKHPVPQVKYLSRVPIFNVSFMKIKFKGKFPEGSLRIKFRHQVYSLGDLTVEHDSGTAEHDISSAGLSLSLPNHLVHKWLVIKVAPERALGKLLSKLGHGRFWCMRDLSDLVMCKSGDILIKEFSEEGLHVEIALKVERKTTPICVRMSTLMGPFEPVNVPVIKLTSQTGMSVCAEHLSNDNAATTVQPSAPQLGTLSPPQNLSSVDATSLQNLMNAGGLANPTPHKESSDEENIVQLEGSPYLHKRRMDSKLSSPSQEQIKASGSASLGDQTATSSRPNSSTEEQATFKVHMATHR
ncbi:Glycine-rich domain-containing protein-like [Trinorchestia longiramus]|nr:Glycine-rich domain-containing protein-like [Trinorchestia longiramus]